MQYPFENFYADDHLSTMMLIDQAHKTLDFHFILWRYETKELDHATLARLDVGPGGNSEDEEELSDADSQNPDGERKQVEQIKGSSCCTIF